jgi:transposase-like protein
MENVSQKKGKRTQGDYSFAFKLRIIEEVESGDLTYKQAQKKYGIQGKSTVLVWLRKHGKLNWQITNLVSMNNTPSQRIKELETKLAEAEKRAHEAELKARLLDTIIDVAEGEFGFEIRKKHLPKQPKPSQKKRG